MIIGPAVDIARLAATFLMYLFLRSHSTPSTSTPNVNLQQRTPQTVVMLTPALQQGGFSSCCSEPFVLDGPCPELPRLPNAPHDSPRVFGTSSEANGRNPIVIWCLHGRRHVAVDYPLSPSPRTPARHRNGMATTFGPAPHFQSLADPVEVRPPPLPAHDDRRPPPQLHLKEPSNSNIPHDNVPCVLCATHPGRQSQPHCLASTAHPPPKLRPDTHNSNPGGSLSILLENKPGDGTTSLTLLSPQDNSRSHSRRPSNATTTNTEDGTVTDHPGFYPAISDVTTSARPAVDTLGSPTPMHVGSVLDIGNPERQRQKHEKARKKVKGSTEETPKEEGEGDDEDKILHLNLTQDEHIDPTPFAFKPYHIASLVDPKNLETLQVKSMGGIKGLLAGLGVDPNSGLTIGGKPSESSGDAPAVVVIDPAGEKGGAVEPTSHEGGAYNATVEDRQRVYGPNTLPARKSKSLLQLMWLAFKDKVLVSPSHSHVH